MRPAGPARPARAIGLGIVAAIHLLVGIGLSIALRPAVHDRAGSIAAPVVQWILPPRSDPPAPSRAPATAVPARETPRGATRDPSRDLPRERRPRVMRETAPAGITLPAEAPASLALPALPASAPRSAEAAAPLDLRLRSAPQARSAAELATQDPRANSGRPTIEQRIGNAVGTDQLVEEDLGGGRRRFRKNGACVEVHQARQAQLDPFNQSVSPTPGAAMACD